MIFNIFMIQWPSTYIYIYVYIYIHLCVALPWVVDCPSASLVSAIPTHVAAPVFDHAFILAARCFYFDFSTRLVRFRNGSRIVELWLLLRKSSKTGLRLVKVFKRQSA